MIMKEKMKSTKTLIWKRIWTRELWVTILFLISCLDIGAYEFLKAYDVLKSIETNNLILSILLKLFYALAVSYVPGVFVYFLTVVLPETKRSKPLLVEIEKSLQDIKDSFYSAMEYINSDNAVEIALDDVKQYGKYNDTFYSLQFMNKTLEKLYQSIERLTSNILSYSSALTQNELNIIIEIRHHKIARQMKFKDGVENVLNKDGVRSYFENMVNLYNEIIELHKSVGSRIYKQ